LQLPEQHARVRPDKCAGKMSWLQRKLLAGLIARLDAPREHTAHLENPEAVKQADVLGDGLDQIRDQRRPQMVLVRPRRDQQARARGRIDAGGFEKSRPRPWIRDDFLHAAG
jgi:hypothetical protein